MSMSLKRNQAMKIVNELLENLNNLKTYGGESGYSRLQPKDFNSEVSNAKLRQWRKKTQALLAKFFDKETIKIYKEIEKLSYFKEHGKWEKNFERRIAPYQEFLENILNGKQPYIIDNGGEEISSPSILETNFGDIPSHSVFIVHGRENETKETVARFVQKMGLKPIILHEQPNTGLTVIEKLETFSKVSFAVILLTPDDVGGLASDKYNLRARARQNVILEMGYFLGKLARNRVCALYKQNIEIPSDYEGVLYIELDEKGGWKTKLAQEFVHAGLSINVSGLLEP